MNDNPETHRVLPPSYGFEWAGMARMLELAARKRAAPVIDAEAPAKPRCDPPEELS